MMKRAFTLFMTLAAGMIIAGTSAAGSAGTKLPADGGAPGKDYMAYVNAVHKRDGATIKKMAEVPAGTSDSDFKQQMEMAAAMTPTDQKIVSGTMNKDAAVLKVTGKLEGKKQYGTIQMQKKGGAWKITNEAWSETEKK